MAYDNVGKIFRKFSGKAVDGVLAPTPARYLDQDGDLYKTPFLNIKTPLQRRLTYSLAALAFYTIASWMNGDEDKALDTLKAGVFYIGLFEIGWRVGGRYRDNDYMIDMKPSLEAREDALAQPYSLTKGSMYRGGTAVVSVGVGLASVAYNAFPEYVVPLAAYWGTQAASVEWQKLQLSSGQWVATPHPLIEVFR